MIYKGQSILRWSVAPMAILIALAIGCGSVSVSGNLMDSSAQELLLGGPGILTTADTGIELPASASSLDAGEAQGQAVSGALGEARAL